MSTNNSITPAQKHFQYSLPLHVKTLRDMAEALNKEIEQKRKQAAALLSAAAELEMVGGIYAPRHEDEHTEASICLGFALRKDAEREAAQPKPEPKPRILENDDPLDFDNLNW